MKRTMDAQRVADGNKSFELRIVTVPGDRPEQQDSFGYQLHTNEGLVILCDGMGGLSGGSRASDLAVTRILDTYDQRYPSYDPETLLKEAVVMADADVAALKGADGRALGAGSTCVAVIIKERKLFWNSVGDSRAYLFRNGEFEQFTLDHTYDTVLKEQINAGEITEKEYEGELKNAEKLVSYLGLGNLDLMDYNSTPLALKENDRILIVTDGLYKLLDKDEIGRIMDNFADPGELADVLEARAKAKARREMYKRDNTTIIVIQIK